MALYAIFKTFKILVTALWLQSVRSLNAPTINISAMINSSTSNAPMMIPLRRETVPVKRKGKVVSFRTSYSGMISVGRPAQMFRVVFDTGSGHLVLPSVECGSEACQVHQQYDQSMSETAVSINADGQTVLPGKPCDRVSISYGTGSVKGEFVQDEVCISHAIDGDASDPDNDREWEHSPCLQMHTVMAVEMSTMPFKNFGFDGIMGLGLSALSLRPEFSFFRQLTLSGKIAVPHFGVFLTDGEDGEQSEIAIGGHNAERLMTSLSWTPVAKADLGYWQVKVIALRVGGKTLDVCQDGTCHGVMDTGTSHLGIPTPYDQEVVNLLTVAAGDTLDCRLVDLPEIEIELPGVNITLHPDTYMRRLPLREDVSVDKHDPHPNETKEATPEPGIFSRLFQPRTTTTTPAPSHGNNTAGSVKRYCRPRLMPVNMAAPLGPKLFILGEPVLHRYYAVFDWEKPQVGFAVSNTRANHVDRKQLADRIGSLPKDVDVYLMQTGMNMTCASGHVCPTTAAGEHDTEGLIA